ncbi:hypothetical protein LTR37_012671 [Vermiconidia calcicola]|uniref:Uncharacterized protein n=1 Tax=Vermiconidia calcicola TaxID=1690605 RepID=A0ACC3MYT5_9PEZI|nr:hypothetical protein LTR37_012671 [Vermiconidia calcicola]
MADMSLVKAGIVWAMPVRPDLLGDRLEAYAKSLPVLQALRLCHRFGTGSQVHVTKLPTEILLSVEDIVLHHHRNGWKRYDWSDAFAHFESRCEPMEHIHDPYDLIYDIRCEYRDQLCETCQAEDGEEECDQDCDSIVHQKANECLASDGFEWRYGVCETQRDKWLTAINQHPGKNFAKYDEILRKHFGLCAHFSTTRVALEDPKAWPSDPKHDWHMEDELQTTICYLTLPTQMTAKKTFGLSEIELHGGGASIPGTRSSLVHLPTLHQREERVKQFKHALRTLKLEPYVHLSQLNDVVGKGTETADPMQGNEIEKAKVHAKMKKDLEKGEWPQLVMLVNTNYEW